jgi:branched-chain amino acid transport system substrate-binding protein
MSKWISALITILVFFSFELTNADQQVNPIDIGVIYNLTGAQSTLDTFSANGAKLAATEINTHGGILGRPINLIIKDGETNPEAIRKIAKEFGENKNIVAVIGLSDTDMALAAIPTLAANKKLFITSGATGPELPNAAPQWVFLACFSDDEQANNAAIFSYLALGKKSALVIEQNDNSYAKLLTTHFTKSYLQIGGKIIAQKEFNHANDNLSAILKQFKNDNNQPDIIFLAAGPQMSFKMIKQIRDAGFKQPILGGDSLDSTNLDTQAAQDIGTIYFTTHAFIDKNNNNPRVQQFISTYQTTYQQLPDSSFAGLGYDTIGLLAKAITLAKSTDSSKIRAELLKMNNYEGITGTIDFSNHYIPKKTVTFIRFENGKRTVIKF